ncbi:hypothetical protein BGPG180_10080 [Staphylococcus epidermidis]
MALFKKKISLPTQVIIALVLGVIAGLLLYGQDDVANYIKPFGDVFLNLIKMIIIPIVFCSLALSISNLGDSKKVGSCNPLFRDYYNYRYRFRSYHW